MELKGKKLIDKGRLLNFLIILGILVVLPLPVSAVDSTAKLQVAAADCAACHPKYVNTIIAKQHAGTDNCIICHRGVYDTSTHQLGGYIGYIVNATTCNQAQCHSTTSGIGQRPVETNTHTGRSPGADCTQCHFPNTTKLFPINNSYFVHDHNFTVEYNYYDYNISGMPLRTNSGAGMGMFPYYTCTLTCHSTGRYSVENEASSWLESKHARSRVGNETYDSKNLCAKCKSPPNYNVSAPANAPIAAADWQGIQCRVCHNVHNVTYSNPSGFPLAFYNSTLSSLAGYPVYEQVQNATVLCENCHTGANHDSKFAGTHKDRVGFDCASCHANSTFNNESHKFEVKNTTSGVTGCEVCHKAEDHTFQFTQMHTGKVTCEACHDKTVARNASGYAVSSDGTNYGLYLDSATGLVSSWKNSHGAPATWPLHNISRAVSCDKCHGTKSKSTNLLLAPDLSAMSCTECHTTYGNAVNLSMHNRTLNPSAPACTDCHAGYVSGHTTGTTGFIVNETNTCRNCHVEGVNGFNESHGIYHPPGADCTTCHFANTTRPFSLNASLFAHDHNLTVVHNFYDYNQSGMPLASNGGVGLGMFPYYTCTLTCHSGKHSLEKIASSWFESKHARSRVGNETYDSKNSCAKCKSPPNYNVSASANAPIVAADWQGIQCRVCHNLHRPTYSMSTGGFPLAYYNSTASSLAGYQVYEAVPNATVLCENCHTGSSHDSKFAGFHKTTLGYDCANCHANKTLTNETHKFEVVNEHTGKTGCESCHDFAAVHPAVIQSNHNGIVACVACHDQTFGINSTGYAVSDNNNYGLVKLNGEWTTYKLSHGAPRVWPLHNVTKAVNCNKCHGAISSFNGTIAPVFTGNQGCAGCHFSYSAAVLTTKHNQTLNADAPVCTDCHTGYQPVNGHTSGNKGYVVNESNTCRNCHVEGVNGFNESHGIFHPPGADCTTCHFANTTRPFSLNASLTTHDHNLKVVHNFYDYNQSGMPLASNGGVGAGMFPYYTCTLTCHSGKHNLEEIASSWLESKHARSRVGNETYDSKNSCAKCKSPPNYNVNASANAPIAAADWQGIQCRVCHNLHRPTYSISTGGFPLAYYNSTASSLAGYQVYEAVPNATVLCENCHTGSSHDSKFAGFHKTTLGYDCANCHANKTFNNETHLFEVKNTTSGVTGCQVCHSDKNPGTHPFAGQMHTPVDCVACHDQTFTVANATGYAVSSDNKYGIYKDPATQKWTTYKLSHGSPATWPLHNLSRNVDCTKCHGAKTINGQTIALAFGATPTPTPVGSVISQYDTNSNGRIDRDEAIRAVTDYFGGALVKQDALSVIMAFFSG